MAILGLCHTLGQLYPRDVEETQKEEEKGKLSEEWRSLVTEGRLWKLAKHQNPSVSMRESG